jgi:hypothetical protein
MKKVAERNIYIILCLYFYPKPLGALTRYYTSFPGFHTVQPTILAEKPLPADLIVFWACCISSHCVVSRPFVSKHTCYYRLGL